MLKNKVKNKMANQQLTQKIRIFPNEKQEIVLWKLSERCRLLYNFALDERIKLWDLEKKRLTYIEQANKLKDIKKQYPEYNWVYSKVLQEVLKSLDSSYKSFYKLIKKDKNARLPKFRGSKYFFTMNYNQSGFKLYQDKIKFSHKYDKTNLEFKIPSNFKFDKVKQVSIFQEKNNWYISVVHETLPKEFVCNNKFQAIDLGVTNIVTAINEKGKFLQIKNNRAEKYWNPKIDKLKSRRDHCKKFSNKWKFLNSKIIKLSKKKSSQLKDFQHKLSRKIIDNTKANTIIVGDLNVKSMAQSKKVAKKLKNAINTSTQNTGSLSRFTQFLTYKANLVGKRLIKIDESNTSKCCYNCGKKHDMKLFNRYMICDCGVNIDRDKNSSINILKRYLSQIGLWIAHSKTILSVLQPGNVDYKDEALYLQEATS